MPCVYLPGPAPAVTVANNYFLMAFIQYWKESSKLEYQPLLHQCRWHRGGTEELNIFANIWKNSESFIGMPIGTGRSCLTRKTGGKISRDTVPFKVWALAGLVFMTCRGIRGFCGVQKLENLNFTFCSLTKIFWIFILENRLHQSGLILWASKTSKTK